MMRATLLAVLVLLAPVTSGAQERPLITAVDVRGVKSVDRDLLSNGIVTQPTKCRQILYAPFCMLSKAPVLAERHYLDAAELRRDVLRIRLFYWRRGYRDARVTARTERSGDGVRVIIDINEEAPTRITQLDVVQEDSALTRQQLTPLIPLKAGDPLDLIQLDSAALRVREMLWNEGYPDARVVVDTSQVSNEANEGPVTLRLIPGPLVMVTDIVIAGTAKVQASTVRQLLHLKPGSRYRRHDVLQSQRDLYMSGLFDNVELGTGDDRDSARTLVVRVNEAPLNRLELRGGATTADFVQVQAELTRQHVLGGARRLTLRGTLSNLLANQLNGRGAFYDVTNGAPADERAPFLRPTWSASVEVLQPWAFGPRNQIGVSVFTHRRSQPGIVTERGRGASAAVSRDVSDRASATVSYTFETTQIEASDVYFCVSVGLCIDEAIDAVSGRNRLASLSGVYQLDTSDDPFEPTMGWRARGELEHASAVLASDFGFNRANAFVTRYGRVGAGSVLAARIRAGWVRPLASTNRRLGANDPNADPIVHPRKSFFSGGSRSVRGYGENQLGPRVLTIDPGRLLDTTLASPCTAATIASGDCDPNIAGLRANAFQPRPLGGTAIAEANVELRFPLQRSYGMVGAVFLDAAIVGTARFTDLLRSTAALTPGFGVRMDTPVGPVRFDVGIRPRVLEDLPVITQVTDSTRGLQLVTLRTLRRYDAAEATGGALRQILSRLTLHLALGPAF